MWRGPAQTLSHLPANTSASSPPRDLSQRRLASLVSAENSTVPQCQRTELPYQVCLMASRGHSEGVDWPHPKPQQLAGTLVQFLEQSLKQGLRTYGSE